MIYTVGHSTRPLGELVGLLEASGVKALADVRLIPRSKRHPQYDIRTLPEELAPSGIAYLHFPDLGGRRRPRPDSPNGGWKSDSFRGYADHMETPQFRRALDALLSFNADKGPAAVLCAESVPWRCHRSLLSDALTARGVEVFHVISGKTAQKHKLTPFAKLDRERVLYPPEQAEFKF